MGGSDSGRAGLGVVLLLTVLAVVGYTAFAAGSVYQGLNRGRAEVVAAQTSITAAGRAGDAAKLQGAQVQLKTAEQDFSDAQQRADTDPSLRAAGAIPGSAPQVRAAAHLGGIGADLSRAGEGAATVALQVTALKQRYSGRPLSADDLQAILQQAQGIAASYKGSIQQIGLQLKAAHAERAQVATADLLPPLQQAYADVDRALTDADTAFLRYQDVRQVLSGLLGVPLAG